MVHIDIETLKRLHNVYDDLILGNVELSFNELGKILREEQLIIPVVVSSSITSEKGVSGSSDAI